ncbi:uncharacterized protein [Panulirus ornatus]|uniref:uncharacterized protein isoform X2 n=1 Tax=Panulirus ornatus TaxID=150431 RepID=UPI003A895311
MEGNRRTDMISLDNESLISKNNKVQYIRYELNEKEYHENLKILEESQHEFQEKVQVLRENEKKLLEKVNSSQENVPVTLITTREPSRAQVNQEFLRKFEEENLIIQEKEEQIRNSVKTSEEDESEDPDCCAASSLNYCEACLEGPKCCVDLEYHDEADNHSDTSTLVAADSAGDFDYSHQNSEEESVISYYIGKEDQEVTVLEYEFFVNDNDDDELNLRCRNEDGFIEGYDDEDGGDARYKEEEHHVCYEEHCGDDKVEEYYLDDEGSSQCIQGSGAENLSCYQEPLEVILEILGEEGEDQGKDPDINGDKKVNIYDSNKLNTEDDLMTFSNSGELNPSCIEEYKSTHDDSNTVSPEKVSNSDPSNFHQTLLGKTETAEYEATDGKYIKTYPSGAKLTICNQYNINESPLISLTDDSFATGRSTLSSPSCSIKEEESDRDKLKNLTSEIEAYLKETTMLLESATSYASKVAPNGVRSDGLSEFQVRKTFTSTGDETSNLINQHIECVNDSSTLRNGDSAPVEAISARHPSFASEVSKQPPRKPNGVTKNCTSTDNIKNSPSVKENICCSIAPETETERLGQNGGNALDISNSCSESTDVFQSLMETKSEYFSAIETSGEAMEALDWEEKISMKKQEKPERIIYKPQERTQDDDNYFTSPKNVRKVWLAAFQELEDRLDDAIKDDRPDFQCNVYTPASDDENTDTAEGILCHDQEVVHQQTLSRCDSPPPTVFCLENLEKLCNRLSQEHEKITEGVNKTAQLSIKERDGYKCISHEDIRRQPVGVNKSDTLMNISPGCNVTEELNKINSKRRNHPMMGLQQLQNHISLQQLQNQIYLQQLQNHTGKAIKQTDFMSKLDNLMLNENAIYETLHVCGTKSRIKENGQFSLMRENEIELFNSQGDTSGTSPMHYIDSKLDEIFSCVENVVSTNFVPEVKEAQEQNSVALHNIISLAAENPDTVKENVRSQCIRNQEENDIQVQLNNILDGLDIMYEKYLMKKLNMGEEQSFNTINEGSYKGKETTDSLFNERATHFSHTEENKTWRSSCENTAFQDIIDISEDLKHLCVFHVNKSSTGTWPESIVTTQKETLEEAYPEFFYRGGDNLDAEITDKVKTYSLRSQDSISEHMADHKQSSQTQSVQEEQKENFEYLEKNRSGGTDWPEGGKTDAATFLVTLREENLKCYELTFRCLENIITRTNTLLDAVNLQNMSALQLAAESRDYLMWCPDQDFDDAVSTLDIRGLVELVQTLQDAMAVEQQTFDSLSQQLELIHDPLQQQRLSAALCTSQTRLARLCSRNMRCFRQQALKARQKETPESRSSSPRDSGLVTSSAAASDAEGDPRSPTGVSFKNSLAFFQRAAHLVANNAKNTSMGARQKEVRRRSSRGSSCYGSSSSEAWSLTSDEQAVDFISGMGGMVADGVGAGGFEEDLAKFEDQGTYEQVLFVNGRPQYQDDVSSSSGERSRSGSWTRVRIDGSSGDTLAAAAQGPDSQPHSVAHTYTSLPRRPAASAHAVGDSVTAAEAQTQTQAEDLSSYVTVPRRKPYLNFKSVSCALNNSSGGADLDNEDLRYFKERVGVSKNSGVNAITRTQSFKEGLNCYSHEYSNNACGLSRTQSFHDGLARDFNELESGKQKLQRAPSVDEILESVKSLRAKKTMVKSTPDLSVQEPVYHSASLPRHKGSKGKTPRPPGTSSLLGVRYNGPSNDPQYERVPDPEYEQIPESSNHYENVCKENNHYENIHLKGEVIYDSPRPMDHHHYDKVHNDLHYENVKYDVPVYENVDENEPTYMNVNGTSEKGNMYANLDTKKKTGSIRSSKVRSNKVTVSGNSMMEGTTYDVPRAATHIYDSPQKQVRSVGSPSEYDTPKNNRSVLPQSTQIILKAKSEQKQRIDDIFADCDQDSLEGDRDREPDIPSPDYDSEEEGEGYEDASNEYVTSEFHDEGLGESDSRSYYAEDPAGLEVILEEPEEEYCSSHASEDDLRRDVDITYALKGERRSLDGSEGIGSAEGDTHSSGGSEHYGEEDCASSGIHSEDTPSPGPPVDSEKDEHHHAHRNAPHEDKQKEDRTQQDRCVEVYPETVRQRQRNMMASSNKVDIKNWNSSAGGNGDSQTSPAKVKKFLPSVKALRNQFEAGKTNVRSEANGSINGNGTLSLSRKSSNSTSSLASSTLEKTSSTNSLSSTCSSMENLLSPSQLDNRRQEEPVEPIYNQFKKVDEELRELMNRPPSTTGWDPQPLLKRLYYVPEAPKMQSQGTTYINIEGYLEKLPSGRKKATFWNAWKRRYFVAKDGVLYYYQNNQTDKPNMKMPLMGGKVECMEPNMVGVDDGSHDTKASAMLGIDDGKGHYVVVRCNTRQEAERWRRALETHTVEDFASQYVQPWPIPTNPALLRDTLVIDIGSASIRAGVLASQATLPQVFLPSVVATDRESRRQVWGFDALSPDVRASSCVSFPIRPSHKISKYSVDMSAVSSLLQKTFASLKVDPKNYHVQLSVPRVLNTNTQTELLRVLFDKYGVRSVNLTHQSILALYAYNATSGIIVDIGERMEIVPVIDGYIVDGGVSRVPYGGYRILDHLRQFLYMRNISLINEVESYLIRYVLENLCYCAHHYNTEKARCTNSNSSFARSLALNEYFHGKNCPYESISLDLGRFQATEGLFNPDAWGLDHPGIHKLVHKAIMECSMDIRKEMSRSIFLAGGVTQLPGFIDRLTTEIDNLTPPAIRPKVHASPYRYHASYIGACVLAESPAFNQSRISSEDWNKQGSAALRKWSM